jgi:small subunit ribosomal protein S17
MSDGENTPAPSGGQPKAPRRARRSVIGEVISSKMQKTIAVEVVRLERHQRYDKYVKRHTVYKAHDEGQVAREGDLVRIIQTRPLSKTKHWRLGEVLRRSEKVAVIDEIAAGGQS